MASTSTRWTLPSLTYFIILIGLIYTFHTELFIIGTRLYAGVGNNPRVERLLGDYYKNNARLSTGLSNTFYADALKKYQSLLASSTDPIEQANTKLQIGLFYLCGKGMLQNQAQAKRWFDEAQQTLGGALKNDESHERLVDKLKEAQAAVAMGNVPSHSLPICQFQSQVNFMLNTFKPL